MTASTPNVSLPLGHKTQPITQQPITRNVQEAQLLLRPDHVKQQACCFESPIFVVSHVMQQSRYLHDELASCIHTYLEPGVNAFVSGLLKRNREPEDLRAVAIGREGAPSRRVKPILIEREYLRQVALLRQFLGPCALHVARERNRDSCHSLESKKKRVRK